MATSTTAQRGLRVLVSGASGMVGKSLCAALSTPSVANAFHPQVFKLVRRQPQNESEVYWDPYEMRIDIKKIEGMDAVVHLAGENVGSGEGLLAFTGRWSDRKKHNIMESRRRGTTLLSTALASLKSKPKVFISASGIGYYGDGGNAELTETSSKKGKGFLSDVADVWESTTGKAKEAGIRVVNLRFGVILSKEGGVIQKLYVPTFLGGGASRMGSGTQYMSWVTLHDAVRAIQFTMKKPELEGPVNVCSPNPVQNAEFMSSLASCMHRPALVPFPEPLVRLAFGEMGEETLLVSQRGIPAKLQAAGFNFLHSTIDEGMNAALYK